MDFLETGNRLAQELMDQRDPQSGVWSGRLSSSALSTALAVTALEDGAVGDRESAKAGVQWLVDTINSDGGWGDTPESPSNVSSSLIARACISRHSGCIGAAEALADSGAWIVVQTGGLSLPDIAKYLRSVYGEDKTFSVPILMYLAICSSDESGWLEVPSLPFMLALLPGWCYRFFKLEVVSYALPALISVGLCRHLRVAAVRSKKAWGRLFATRLLTKLESLQPEHGGFLDAIPLTAFVVIALKNSGYADHPVAELGSAFLRASIRKDGSWPIDSNLRIWVSSLSARVLAERVIKEPGDAKIIVEWLIKQQHLSIHPFTGAGPGGWGWTDLPGGVPDADDTSAVLIALCYLKEFTDIASLTKTVRMGLTWLMDLLNSDGGMPTFCRGWGKLPFDKSCCDITAHSLEAFALWTTHIKKGDYPDFNNRLIFRMRRSMRKMIVFLESSQQSNGSWMPLWFGHQQGKEKLNYVIGTARVVKGLHVFLDSSVEEDNSVINCVAKMLECGESFLVRQQKGDGGWTAGNESTIEESALVITALSRGSKESRSAAERGAVWLADRVANNEIKAAPVGLYFSVLWYDEALYPLIWSLEALNCYKCECADKKLPSL